MTAEPPTLLVRGASSPGGRAGAILFAEGRIAALGAAAEAAAPRSACRLEADGLIAAPGYIDLQVNGAAGDDLTADPASVWRVGEALPRYGVSAFLPTIVSGNRALIEAARRALIGGPPAGYRGATAVGLHLEGPFISRQRRGVHDPRRLRRPDPAVSADWSPGRGVRLVTLAPELPGALDLVRSLVASGVVVSAGHSAATYDQAGAAFDAGVTMVTHLFNAMAPLAQREPGLAGAALTDPRVVVGIIADGVHVHPALVRVAWRAARPARLALASDAIAALGMPAGTYPLGATDVEVDGAVAMANGRLAGSVLSLDAAVRNLVAFAGASPAQAIAAASAVPARVLRLGRRRGLLRVGSAGDSVLLDRSLRVVATIVGGRLVHDSHGLERGT